MKDLIDRKAGRMKLIDAPVGVFVFHDELVLKTEYMTNIDGVYIPDCYILSTGEKFWGGMKSKEDFKTKYNNLDVEVIDIMPSAHLETKQQATASSDCIIRQDAIDAFWKIEAELRPSAIDAVLNMLKNLPSAQSERKTGRWVERNPQNSPDCRLIECSECGNAYIVGYNIDYDDWIDGRDFCMRCGADLRGGNNG